MHADACAQLLSRVWLLATPRTVAHQAQTLSMWFPRPKYWSGLPFLSPTYIPMLCYAKSLQSCPTLCDPIDGSPPGSPVPGILQARTLEWVAISFSSAWKWNVQVKSLSRVRLLATPWSAAYQAPPSMDFPGKGTGVGCHCLLRILPIGMLLTTQTVAYPSYIVLVVS